MADHVIGVDAGNSKTVVVVAATTGRVLASQRGPGVASPLADPTGWREGLVSLVEQARLDAGVSARRSACAVYCLANIDLPVEWRFAKRALHRAGLAEFTVVQNDTFAVLWAGASRRWGIAVVAGAGINAVGVHPSGRTARFLALGDYTGDVGGGHHIGVQALAAAIRARDGRGRTTVLTAAVPQHFGLRRPEDVAIAVHRGAVRHEDLHVLAPAVFAAAAAGDVVAARIIAAFADEVVLMVGALARRLRLVRADVEVAWSPASRPSYPGRRFGCSACPRCSAPSPRPCGGPAHPPARWLGPSERSAHDARAVDGVPAQPQRSYGLSYGDLEELLAGHGITVDGGTIYRWVQTCTPS
jgi:N-acetylglucosamine kinase-like BadF-type ATPase